jgi:hypothetical protein
MSFIVRLELGDQGEIQLIRDFALQVARTLGIPLSCEDIEAPPR